jgi:hypothetical protein
MWTRAVIGVFLAALLVPLGASTARIGTRTATAESATADASPPSLFGWLDYFDDHFGFRQQLIRAHAWVSFRALGVSPSATVIKGRDGWLFYADDSALEDYESVTPFDETELAAWRDNLVAIRDALRARGVEYVFALAPDKHVIYPEYMPATIHRQHDQYRLDQLLDYLHGHSDLRVVDLRVPLFDGKARERVFHVTDTHWNDRGAFIGSNEILRAAAPAGVRPDSRDAFVAAEHRRPGMDLTEMLSASALFTETSLDLTPRVPRRARVLEPKDLREGYEVARVVTEIDAPLAGRSVSDGGLPRAVVFRDSFGTGLIPFLSEHFSRAVYLWQNNVDMDVVAQEKPSIVIHEIVGRRLQTLDPSGLQ